MKFFILCLFTVTTHHIYAQDYTLLDKQAFEYPYTTDYQKMAKGLTAMYEDDLSKARIIYAWIAHHIKYDVKHKAELKSKSRRENRIKGTEKEIQNIKQNRIDKAIKRTLKRKKGVCQDYAWLYQSMCDTVGLETVFISGFGRFSPLNIGKIHKRDNHAWNAVKINGEWSLVDVTWSAGMGSKDDFGSGFFAISPEVFILSHFPTEKKWQLLNTPISKEVFSAQPFMYPGFIMHNVKKIVPAGGKIAHDHTLTIDVELRDRQEIKIKKGKTIMNYSFTSSGNMHYLDLSKTKLLGKITVCIEDDNSISPLLALKVIN